MIKITKTIAFAMSFLCLNGVVASATTGQESNIINNEKQVLVEYLEAVKNEDVSKIISLSDDERINSDSEHKELLEEIMTDDSNQIKSYKIKDEYRVDDMYYFDLLIKYNNNEEEELSVSVSNKNGSYIVNAGQTVYADKNNIGKETFNSTVNPEYISPREQLRSYLINYSFTGVKTKVYTSSFNTPNNVWINAKQYATNSYNSAIMKYSIVKKGVISDTSYASGQLDRNSQTGSGAIYLTPGSRSGVCLKIENIGPGSNSDGSRYPVTVIGEVYPR